MKRISLSDLLDAVHGGTRQSQGPKTLETNGFSTRLNPSTLLGVRAELAG